MKNYYKTSHDFNDVACITFKITNEYEIFRNEIGDGIYENYERIGEDNNYYKSEGPQDELDWIEVIGRKFKGEL